MTTSLSKGKEPVKGKIKGQAAVKCGKKALHPLGCKAFLVAEMERFELSDMKTTTFFASYNSKI